MSGCIHIFEKRLPAVTESFTGPLKQRNIMLFKTGVWTGLRISELVALKISHFLSNGQWLNQIIIKEQKTGNIRRCEIGEEHAAAIRDYISEMINDDFVSIDDYVFQKQNFQGMKPRSFIEIIKTAARSAGMPMGERMIGTHCMRKTFAHLLIADLINDGIPPQEAIQMLSEAMGHRDSKTTMNYIEWNKDHVATYTRKHGAKQLFKGK